YYTGLLDELHLLPGARTAAAIRTAMRQPASGARAGNGRSVRLGFEEATDASLVERRSPRTQRVGSDLSFYRPVRDLRAHAEGAGVLLAWEAPDEQAVAFAVERSADGRQFEEIGRLTPADAERGGRYRYLDPSIRNDVLF